jgi:hypothetical protein
MSSYHASKEKAETSHNYCCHDGGGELQLVEFCGRVDIFEKRAFIDIKLFDPFSTNSSEYASIAFLKCSQSVENDIELALYR